MRGLVKPQVMVQGPVSVVRKEYACSLMLTRNVVAYISMPNGISVFIGRTCYSHVLLSSLHCLLCYFTEAGCKKWEEGNIDPSYRQAGSDRDVLRPRNNGTS